MLMSSPSLLSAFSITSASPTDSVSEMRSSLESLLVFDSSYKDVSRSTGGKIDAGWLHLHQSAAQFYGAAESLTSSASLEAFVSAFSLVWSVTSYSYLLCESSEVSVGSVTFVVASIE